MHFQTWSDKAGNAPAVTDPTNGLAFPDLADSTNPRLKGNLIMPEPTVFLPEVHEVCAIIRPTLDQFGGALATVNAFVAGGLFRGQTDEFLSFLTGLAHRADAAQRGV